MIKVIYNKLSDRELAIKYNTTDKIIADIISQINNGRNFNRFGWDYPLRKCPVCLN